MKLKGSKNVYEEIAEQYRQYIAFGVLKEGERLPSCRELAIELGINPNTVDRAYALLESEGAVITVPKKGTYVQKIDNKKNCLLVESENQIRSMKSAGLDKNELYEIISRVYKEE